MFRALGSYQVCSLGFQGFHGLGFRVYRVLGFRGVGLRFSGLAVEDLGIGTVGPDPCGGAERPAAK